MKRERKAIEQTRLGQRTFCTRACVHVYVHVRVRMHVRVRGGALVMVG